MAVPGGLKGQTRSDHYRGWQLYGIEYGEYSLAPTEHKAKLDTFYV